MVSVWEDATLKLDRQGHLPFLRTFSTGLTMRPKVGPLYISVPSLFALYQSLEVGPVRVQELIINVQELTAIAQEIIQVVIAQ